jgi:ankyrin repeat protein
MGSANNTEILNFLLLHGADVNISNDWGDTPLIEVVQRGNYVNAKLLISAGSDIHTKNANNKSALNYALENKLKISLSFLLKMAQLLIKRVLRHY